MKTTRFFLYFLIGAAWLSGCKKNDEINDAEQLAALRNVTVAYDSLVYTIQIPDGALTSGKTFDELAAEDPETYKNPANYGVSLSLNLLADNTKDETDAKFDGMTMGLIMDTIRATPINLETGPVAIPGGNTQTVSSETSINLETHRLTGLYIFRQTVDGNDLATTLKPEFAYELGILKGTIPLPELTKDVPTRATPEMKTFLAQLLASGVFDIQQ